MPRSSSSPVVHTRILIVAILASFVAFLDGSIITVALPAISEELGGGLTIQQWVVDSYLIALGSLILLAGSLSDLTGRVRILRIGLVAFGVTSVLCGLAPTGELLVAARFGQGIAGALLVPSSLALIIASHERAAQGRAIGLWTAWTSGAFIAGPLLGGVLTDVVGWRWIFLINILPIVVTLVAAARLPDDRPATRTPIDVVGALLGALGLTGVVFALIEQGALGWDDPLVITSGIAGVVLLAGFVVHERRTAHPMLPLSIFRSTVFSAGNAATAFIYAALGAAPFALVVYLQQVQGFSATLAGLVMLPVTVLNIALSSYFGTWAGRVGARWFMTVGPAVSAVGLVALTTIEEPVAWWQLVPGVLLLGLGLSITVAPLTAAVLGAVAGERSGVASAVNNAIARIAGLLAVAVLGTVAGGVVSDAWLDRALWLCAGLMAAGAIVSAVGVRDGAREAG